MSDTIRVTILVEGNQHGYYQDDIDLARHVERWIDRALFDSPDIQAWSTTVEYDIP